MLRKIAFIAPLLLCTFTVFAQGVYRGPQLSFGKFAPNVNASANVPTTAEILATGRLTIDSAAFGVASFTFSIKLARGDYMGPYAIEGNALTAKVMEIIKDHSGTAGTVYFENIMVFCPDHSKRLMTDLAIKYKN